VPLNDLGRQARATARLVDAVVSRVAASGWYILGNELAGFEAEFGRYCGVPHCIGVANGTDALELALRAVGVSPGDCVVTVANAGMYGTAAIRAVGARPIYVDVDWTLLVDPVALEGALAGATALIVTHLYGRMVDMLPVVALARQRGVAVIEDCAQAHGAERDGRKAGTFGDVGCFSFYPTKNLGAIGDGGALVTCDGAVAVALRQLRQYGWKTKYVVATPGGRNSRLDELQAAVLAAKLPLLEGWNERRRAIARRYASGIRHPQITTAPPGGTEYVAHLYVVRTQQRDALRAHLAAAGIATDIHYPVPDHRQPAYAHEFPGTSLPVSEQVANEVLSLPCFPELTDQEVDRVIAACNAW
jgi:dTDP-4-amino-4,6-dideoxygalactose transaminase